MTTLTKSHGYGVNLTSSIKREIREFHTVVVQWRSGKEICKKSVIKCKVVVLLIEPFSFLRFSLRRRRRRI